MKYDIFVSAEKLEKKHSSNRSFKFYAIFHRLRVKTSSASKAGVTLGKEATEEVPSFILLVACISAAE